MTELNKRPPQTKQPQQKPFPRRVGTKLSPQARGSRWEKNVYLGIDEYLKGKTEGAVIHLVQRVLHGHISEPQIVDILVLNAGGRSFAVECKASGKDTTRFARWFGGKAEQFAKEGDFLRRSGNTGIVALLLPCAVEDKSFVQYGAYLLPWSTCEMIKNKTERMAITTDVLDRFDAEGAAVRIPTTDGTVHFDPDSDPFAAIIEAESRACGKH